MTAPHPCADCGATLAFKVGDKPWLCEACFWARLSHTVEAVTAADLAAENRGDKP